MSNKKSNKVTPADNASNMKNANKGQGGTNRQYDQVHGNRGAQLQNNIKNKEA